MPPNQLTGNLKKKSIFSFLFGQHPGFGWIGNPQLCRPLRTQDCQIGHCVAPKKIIFLENSSKSLATKKKFSAFLEKLATLKNWPFFGHSPYSLPNEWFGQVQNLFRLILLPHLQTKLENDHILTLHYFYFWQPWTVSFITISTINHFTIKTFLFDITEENL